jgi:serine/threonine-protein kinase
MIRRFVHELKYTRKITHKNVIRLHDFLEIEGTHAISMEYFAGQSLAKILRDEGRLEWKRGVGIAQEICEGLHAAHSEKIIHRDIKPPNILVGDDDSVKVVDFGLASMVQQAGSRLTKSGILIGTPHYMAPEQINGRDVGICSDIYSLGALLFEMFSGKPPFEGETAVSILFQHLKSPTPVLDSQALEIPEALVNLVKQAMSKEPQERPKSMQEILDKLLALPI